jgi:hypothetical protein
MCAKCYATATHGRYCGRHKDEERVRERRYNKDPLRRLFQRKAWTQTRDQILADDPVCAFVDAQGNRCPLLATDVHHKIQADKWIAQGGDFYDMDNLEGLCHAHHSHYTGKEAGFGA